MMLGGKIEMGRYIHFE